jgi:hypothetical protein
MIAADRDREFKRATRKIERRSLMAQEDRIARLARQIGEEVRKEHHLLLTDGEVLELRQRGAEALFAICADFAATVNRHLAPPVLELAPPDYSPEMFRNSGTNLFQLNAHGRIVQLAFESTRDRFSTEKFLIPYILEGEVRAYNQEMLERTQVRSLALFFCMEENRNGWRYYEWANGRTGVFDRDQLVGLMERIV